MRLDSAHKSRILLWQRGNHYKKLIHWSYHLASLLLGLFKAERKWDEMIHRLIYRSTLLSSTTDAAMYTLARFARQKNSEFGITGILLFKNKSVLQVLEGSFKHLNALYHNIVQDPRHKKVQLISYSLTAERVFSSWGMKEFNLDFIPEHRKSLVESYFAPAQEMHTFTIDAEKALALCSLVYLISGDFSIKTDS